MKKILLLFFSSLAILSASAQLKVGEEYADHNKVVNVQAQVRVDFMQDYWDGTLNKPTSGFKGKYINLFCIFITLKLGGVIFLHILFHKGSECYVINEGLSPRLTESTNMRNVILIDHNVTRIQTPVYDII